jgi:pyruvate/2-oxoglutarate dehydrogenase complex dihydrolipoamide acyltransferase (E2) component
MPSPLHVPRINNNDDKVRVVRIMVGAGDHIRRGQTVAEIETDKAIADVEAGRDGFVLAIQGAVGEELAVGGVLMWIGEAADEGVPQAHAEAEPARRGVAEPTAKARALLAKYGLRAEDVPASGDRLSAGDVEAFAAGRAPTAPTAGTLPETEGTLRSLSVEERGMVHTVSWHRDQAAAAYLEIEYDPSPWERYVAGYATAHRLMMSPLLPLMAHRLVTLALKTPRVNSTIIDGQLYEYGRVNLGFTVQAGETLYLVVMRDAAALGPGGFLDRMGELQRRAVGKKLRPEESRGATVSFSSMARWNVSRHMPILPPYTSLIVAHAAPRGRAAVLGATYDHRVLSGAAVAGLLQKLAQPGSGDNNQGR